MQKRFSQLMMIFALGGLVFFTSCKEKEGCTDPQALNFDPEAEKDDGNCEYPDPEPTVITVTDDGTGTGTTTWETGKTYLLDGFVFVNSGQTLTIQPGTIIKGKAGQGASASALICARGGKIEALGTASLPIIMTAEQDDVTDPNDIPIGTRGLWGGLIVLGSATLNSSPGVTQIEGIPSTEPRGEYGGSNDIDNSGTYQYISIRYGGTDIGSGNEINGMTFGGVGSGTIVEHIEVAHNADDGFEFFGGTVNTKWLIANQVGDDSYDYDEGFRGKGQFWVMVNDPSDGDRGGEHDGGTNPEDGSPYAHPVIYNATYIGRGEAEGKRAVTFRDNAAGEYHNSIFMEFGKGIDVERLASGHSSWVRYYSGDLVISGNVFYNVAGNTATEMFKVSLGTGVTANDSTNAADSLAAVFATWGNEISDPGLNTAIGSLNLNPTNSAVLSGATAATDGWFESVSYRGAFDGSNNWMSGWALLGQ